MIGWLWRVIVGRFRVCGHRWEILKKGTIVDGGRTCGNWYDLRCANCGWIRTRKT